MIAFCLVSKNIRDIFYGNVLAISTKQGRQFDQHRRCAVEGRIVARVMGIDERVQLALVDI